MEKETKNINNGIESGTRALKGCILILCVISWFNTAYGLKEYVFENTPIMAYMISFVFQGNVAVISLKGISFAEKIKVKIVKYEDEIRKRITDEKKIKNLCLVKTICMKSLYLIPAIVAFSASIFFDFVFVANSTFSITEKDDAMAGVTSRFAIEQKNILDITTPYYTEFRNIVYEDLENLLVGSPQSGSALTIDWNNYWEEYIITAEDSKENRPSVESIAHALRSDSKLTNEEVDEYLEQHAKYDIDEYISQIAQATTLINVSSLTSEHIDGVKELMEKVQIHLKNLIDKENEFTDKYNRMIHNPNVDEKEESNNSNQNESPKNNEVKDDIDIYMGSDVIFAELQCDIHKEMLQKKNLKDEYVEKMTAVPEETDKSLEAESYRDANWMWAVYTEMEKLYGQISQKRISECKLAIEKIERFNIVLDSITADASYNIALLISRLSESREISLSEIDEITQKIGSALFTQKDSKNIETFKDLKSNLTYYIPLKNIDYYLKNINFYENDNGDFDKIETKKQLDLIIEYLSILPSDIDKFIRNVKENNLRGTSNFITITQQGTADKNDIKTNLLATTENLINIEKTYLNEKNEMIKALEHFYAEDVKEAVLFWFAVMFAISVDLLSLLLGCLIQKQGAKVQ